MAESFLYPPPIAVWFRYCLAITSVFNGLGAISFAPPVYRSIAGILGLTGEVSDFSLWVIASWILIFGVGYAWLAIKAKPEKLFIAIAAACKIAIAFLFFYYWFIGELPPFALVAGLGDLVFAVIFIFWLFSNQTSSRTI